jgi:hypothetical protein
MTLSEYNALSHNWQNAKYLLYERMEDLNAYIDYDKWDPLKEDYTEFRLDEIKDILEKEKKYVEPQGVMQEWTIPERFKTKEDLEADAIVASMNESEQIMFEIKNPGKDYVDLKVKPKYTLKGRTTNYKTAKEVI